MSAGRWLWIVRDDQVTAWADPGKGWVEVPRSSLRVADDSKRWQDFAAGCSTVCELLEAFKVTERIVTVDRDDVRTIGELWDGGLPRSRLIVAEVVRRRWVRSAETERVLIG